MFQFNARSVAPEQSPTPVPKARYKLMVVKSNMKANKNNDGGYIGLNFQILEGAYQGRVINNNYNIWNKNPQAADIASKQLSALCHAINVYDLQGQDGNEDNYLPMLHNIPFEADVSVEGEYNRLTKVYDQQGNAPGEPPVAGQAPPQAPPQAMPPGAWGSDPNAQQPPAQQGWGAPAQQPPAQQPPQQQAPGGWGTPPAQAPAQAPGGWGAPQAPAAPATPPPGNPWGR